MHPANQEIVSSLRRKHPKGTKFVFVSGNFNVVHPGHLRLFDFAAGCGDVLVVGLHRQGHGNTALPEELRLESVRSVSGIDHAFILPTDPEEFIRDLQPDVVVKGKEHESRYNPELSTVESYGGKLLFSSGDVRFSSLDLLWKELNEPSFLGLARPNGYSKRHNFTAAELVDSIERFKSLNIVVIGDLIVDEYVACDALGMSQEDPTLVVSPLRYDRFLGGAAIVAAHARGLGGRVSYLGISGKDDTAQFAREKMEEYGVDAFFLKDESRPTSLKQRFRANNKTLLRISHLRHHDVSADLAEILYEQAIGRLRDAQLLVFSDFNYGCLPQGLVDRLCAYCRKQDIMMVADSQASSQMGDVSRFKGMTLITPTEREARLATHDHRSGLVVLADTLRERAGVENVLITLGAEGILIHAPHTTPDNLITDRLPALNSSPKDVAGAGDSLLAGTAMGLAAGNSIWQSAYLGSVVAALQVSYLGNRPVQASALLQELHA